MPYSNVNHLMLRDQNRGRACLTVIINHKVDAAKLSHHTFTELTQIDRASCFSPLKLCHYLMVTGGFKVGTETVFGRRCSKGFA